MEKTQSKRLDPRWSDPLSPLRSRWQRATARGSWRLWRHAGPRRWHHCYKCGHGCGCGLGCAAVSASHSLSLPAQAAGSTSPLMASRQELARTSPPMRRCAALRLLPPPPTDHRAHRAGALEARPLTDVYAPFPFLLCAEPILLTMYLMKCMNGDCFRLLHFSWILSIHLVYMHKACQSAYSKLISRLFFMTKKVQHRGNYIDNFMLNSAGL